MFPISTDVATALRTSHRVALACEVYDSGMLAATLNPTDGKVTVDAKNALRRRCDVTLVDPTGTLTPERATDLLTPYGNELRLYRGVHLSTGPALIPLGVFGISDCDVDDDADELRIRLTGFDRSRRVRRARFPDVYAVPAGTNVATAIRDLIASRVPGLTYNLATTSATTPTLVFDAGDDPWKAATEMADSIGCDLFFDAQGVVTLRRRVPSSSPAWTFQEGPAATLLALGRKSSDEETYNHVVVTGETPENAAPVRAEAVDDDPTSPTYIGGDYGDVVRFYQSQFIRTVEQAQAAADGFLARSLGQTEQVGLSAIPQPALDVDDVVEVTRKRSKVSGLYVIDSLSIPLKFSGAMSVRMRERRT